MAARLIALLVLLTSVLRAQNGTDTIDTPRGRCAVWTLPVGVSNWSDAAISRCALDRAPVLQPDAPMPPTPRLSPITASRIRVFVDSDGSVDANRTRLMLIMGSDEDFADSTLAAVKRWRFEPGIRGGVPVRSAFDLDVSTDIRPTDTLPAHLEWHYRPGTTDDALGGTWNSDAALPRFDEQQLDSVYAGMLRRLVAMWVIRPTPNRSYCLAMADRGAAVRSRLERLARAVSTSIANLGTSGCIDTPERVRLLLPSVYPRERGQAFLSIAGTLLSHWPPGLAARTWVRWSARCAGNVRDHDPVQVECDVLPDWNAGYADEARPTPARPATSDTEAIEITVLAANARGYDIDTARTIVHTIPRLRDFAVHDSLSGCNSWAAYAPSDMGVYVLHGDLTEHSIFISPPGQLSPPESPNSPLCGTPSSRSDRFVAFFLGGIGKRPSGPVTLCFAECAQRYELDARKNTLAEQPNVRLDIAPLRQDSRRADNVLQVRVLVDPVPSDVIALIVVDGSSIPSIMAPPPTEERLGQWDATLSSNRPFQHVLVYLVRQ